MPLFDPVGQVFLLQCQPFDFQTDIFLPSFQFSDLHIEGADGRCLLFEVGPPSGHRLALFRLTVFSITQFLPGGQAFIVQSFMMAQQFFQLMPSGRLFRIQDFGFFLQTLQLFLRLFQILQALGAGDLRYMHGGAPRLPGGFEFRQFRGHLVLFTVTILQFLMKRLNPVGQLFDLAVLRQQPQSVVIPHAAHDDPLRIDHLAIQGHHGAMKILLAMQVQSRFQIAHHHHMVQQMFEYGTVFVRSLNEVQQFADDIGIAVQVQGTHRHGFRLERDKGPASRPMFAQIADRR